MKDLNQKEKQMVENFTIVDRVSILGIAKDYHSKDNVYRVETSFNTFLGGGVGLECVNLYRNNDLILRKTDHKGYYSAGMDVLNQYAKLVLNHI